MPKRIVLRVPIPMSVYEATQAFGSELRVAILHHYARTPGRQADAAEALGVDRAVVSLNTRALLELGVLIATPSETPRSRVFSVDHDRYDELVKALAEYGKPPSTGGSVGADRNA